MRVWSNFYGNSKLVKQFKFEPGFLPFKCAYLRLRLLWKSLPPFAGIYCMLVKMIVLVDKTKDLILNALEKLSMVQDSRICTSDIVSHVVCRQ